LIRRGSLVRIQPDPPSHMGGVAQLGEHLLCKQGVIGSIPFTSTIDCVVGHTSDQIIDLLCVRSVLIGCRSLKIHRVESALLAEMCFMALPSCQQHFLIASPDFNLNKYEVRHNVNTQFDFRSKNSLTMLLQRGVKVIGSSE
jgi:hypothetical protein